jgi:antitoxin ParD1/3/4
MDMRNEMLRRQRFTLFSPFDRYTWKYTSRDIARAQKRPRQPAHTFADRAASFAGSFADRAHGPRPASKVGWVLAPTTLPCPRKHALPKKLPSTLPSRYDHDEHLLPEALKAFVDAQVAARGYGSASEYLRELIQRERDRQHLRTLLLEGAASGPGVLADDAFFESLRDEIRGAGAA